MELKIRNGKVEDLEACFILERRTFPECEAASKENIKIRLSEFAAGFIVGEIEGKIVAHINSGSTNKDDITDEEFKGLIGHESDGKNIVIFSVAVNPEYQNLGIASKMMREFIEVSKKIKKQNILLLCKENLIGMYEKMGYEKKGISASTHGNAVWYEMIYSL
ncbi:N-acetyltransferase [uncultured Ilyobacter sp.]|uniref:GNAT family N-acetyltransferase n=1 Tax=uncultured Ilyobacter sp. TaxID=544433 RepID=UPI002AA5F96C|nr:N-acetyltransferase [uncultured Ilyobacter sp.]